MEQILDLVHEWTAVESEPGIRYRYPDPLSQHMKENYSGVAVYRWAFYKSEGRTPYMVYVGEAENLSRRIQDYLRGSKKTAKRIKAHLDEEIHKASRIHLDILKFEPFLIVNQEVNESYEHVSLGALCKPFVRKMMENIGVLVHDATSCDILNKAANQMERRRDKALTLAKDLDAMRPEDRAAYYAKYGLKDS